MAYYLKYLFACLAISVSSSLHGQIFSYEKLAAPRGVTNQGIHDIVELINTKFSESKLYAADHSIANLDGVHPNNYGNHMKPDQDYLIRSIIKNPAANMVTIEVQVLKYDKINKIQETKKSVIPTYFMLRLDISDRITDMSYIEVLSSWLDRVIGEIDYFKRNEKTNKKFDKKYVFLAIELDPETEKDRCVKVIKSALFQTWEKETFTNVYLDAWNTSPIESRYQIQNIPLKTTVADSLSIEVFFITDRIPDEIMKDGCRAREKNDREKFIAKYKKRTHEVLKDL